MIATPPRTLVALWLIARRAAIESLQDRMTMVMSLSLALVLPIGLVLASAGNIDVLAINLLVVGLVPAVSAVGIAAGQFAGERERGLLTPLLASPASNVAIFGGKVLGSVIPPLLYAILAQAVYLSTIALVLGFSRVLQLPPLVSISTVVLVPAVSTFAAIVASLISSRVRTFNAAQQLGGIVLMPVWAVVFAAAVQLRTWGPAALLSTIAAIVIVDVLLIVAAAATWRREEVLAHN